MDRAAVSPSTTGRSRVRGSRASSSACSGTRWTAVVSLSVAPKPQASITGASTGSKAMPLSRAAALAFSSSAAVSGSTATGPEPAAALSLATSLSARVRDQRASSRFTACWAATRASVGSRS